MNDLNEAIKLQKDLTGLSAQIAEELTKYMGSEIKRSTREIIRLQKQITSQAAATAKAISSAVTRSKRQIGKFL